jgi:hypothetical protein
MSQRCGNRSHADFGLLPWGVRVGIRACANPREQKLVSYLALLSAPANFAHGRRDNLTGAISRSGHGKFNLKERSPFLGRRRIGA